jgi:hypothetical protein
MGRQTDRLGAHIGRATRSQRREPFLWLIASANPHLQSFKTIDGGRAAEIR